MAWTTNTTDLAALDSDGIAGLGSTGISALPSAYLRNIFIHYAARNGFSFHQKVKRYASAKPVLIFNH